MLALCARHGFRRSLLAAPRIEGHAATPLRRGFRSTGFTADRVFSWGTGDGGQLGHHGPFEKSGVNMTYAELEPRNVVALQDEGVVQLACGLAHSAAVTKDGRLFTWGQGKDHRLGHGIEGMVEEPRVVAALAGVNITKVACGDNHTLAISDEGVLYSWGFGGGQWGTSNHRARASAGGRGAGGGRNGWGRRGGRRVGGRKGKCPCRGMWGCVGVRAPVRVYATANREA